MSWVGTVFHGQGLSITVISRFFHAYVFPSPNKNMEASEDTAS